MYRLASRILKFRIEGRLPDVGNHCTYEDFSCDAVEEKGKPLINPPSDDSVFLVKYVLMIST